MASISHFPQHAAIMPLGGGPQFEFAPVPSWKRTVSNRFLLRSPGGPGLILLRIEV
jgi:hypothetical protein